MPHTVSRYREIHHQNGIASFIYINNVRIILFVFNILKSVLLLSQSTADGTVGSLLSPFDMVIQPTACWSYSYTQFGTPQKSTQLNILWLMWIDTYSGFCSSIVTNKKYLHQDRRRKKPGRLPGFAEQINWLEVSLCSSARVGLPSLVLIEGGAAAW